MIIGALQESPSIPAIANGGDAKEASDDSAFAALLIAVVALPQTEPVLPTAEPTEGDSLDSAAPAAGESAVASESPSVKSETPPLSAASPALDAAQMVSASEIADADSPPAILQAATNPQEFAARVLVDWKPVGAAQQPLEAEEKIEVLPVQPSGRVSSAGVADRAAEISALLDRDQVPSAPIATGLENAAQKSAGDSQDDPIPPQDSLAPIDNMEISAVAGEAPRPESDDGAAEKIAGNKPLLAGPKKDSSGDENEKISSATEPLPALENSAGRAAAQPVRSARAETVLAARASTAGGKEEFTPGPNASRGEEHKSIQGRIHEAVAVPANNPAPARSDDGQKFFNRDAHALPVSADEKNPPNDPLAPGGFPLEPAIARQETQSRPEAEPINWRPTVERLAGDIASQVRIGARDATIQLDPPELGKIKIDLRMDGDKLLAHIAADSPEAQSLLRNHLPELHQALQSQQVNLAEVLVWSGSGSGAAGDFAQNFQQAPGQRQPGAWPGGSSQAERGAANERPRGPSFSNGSGRVSVWA